MPALLTAEEKLPITTMEDLIDALYREYGSHKSNAYIEYYPRHTCRVVQIFDTGKGHSSAITEETRDLEVSLFEEAKKLGYITDRFIRGFKSDDKFMLVEDIHLFPDALEIMYKWRKEEHLRKVRKYMRKRIPADHLGLRFEQGTFMELRIARRWAEINKGIGSPGTLSKLLTVSEEGDSAVTSRDLKVAATVIQWLGTPEGITFFIEGIKSGGGEVQITLPKAD